MEIVWINDGSDDLHTQLLKKALEHFEKTTRFVTVVYSENEGNKGLGYSMARGVETCTNEIIFRMDSDDLMMPNRIQTQLDFMKKTPDCVLCGTQIQCFNDQQQALQRTNHPSIITLEVYKKQPSHWFLNHPTVCFKKSAILEVGNYNDEIHSMMEDFELWLRILKKYKKIYNIPEVLLNYRIHDKQLTYNGGEKGGKYWHEKRIEMIKNIL
jgi:glycosyltransferase involved in cell wall biosynthesis